MAQVQHKVLLSRVKKVISSTHFHNEGDAFEKQWWTFVKERFPNCETFWRYFIVPATNRVTPGSKDPNERIRLRSAVSEEIESIGTLHYSMFLNIAFAYDHLLNSTLSSFEDFYVHLVSTCDLAEEFLLRVYLLILECQGRPSHVLQRLKKREFLRLAGDWYDENYSKLHRQYTEKGKFLSIKIPNRKNCLAEYFNDSNAWEEYDAYAKTLRRYRNVIVHCVQIARILVQGNAVLVPKKTKIQSYKKLTSVLAVASHTEKLKSDFINMKEQMILDIGTLEIRLNALWDKPIVDMTKLFDAENRAILKKYGIVSDCQNADDSA